MKIIHLRLHFLLWLFVLFVLVVIGRLFFLQISQHHFFEKKLSYQMKRIINTAPKRGTIYDRHHQPLAVMETAYSAYAIPHQIKNRTAFSRKIAPFIKRTPQQLYKKLDPKYPFVWVQRKISQDQKERLARLKLKGLDFIKEEKRFYPNKKLASHLLGFVGVDNQGLGGLEYQFDSLLTGLPGKIILEGDPLGRPIISGVQKIIRPTYNGGHIYLTIDAYIQYITEKYLKEGIQKSEAKRGQAIVLDPTTGDILALAAYPDFNPNHWEHYQSNTRKNRCITDIYEPGSVFKIITVCAALEEKLVSPKTILYVPKKLKITNRTIKEAHKRKKGESDSRTVEEIIQKSLNVGTAVLAQKMGKKAFYPYIKAFGFGTKTRLHLPGESPGILRHANQWRAIDVATISYGQGIGVTPIQIASAVGAIANKGLYINPKIFRYVTDDKNTSLKSKPHIKKQVISEDTAQKAMNMLKLVVDRGTGRVAKIRGFKIAGKTGTAQKPIPGGKGYYKDLYMASFIGILTADQPKAVILVIIDSPKKSIWGSTNAGPVFKNIAEALIDYLDLVPSKK